jgi:hypothetical protein
MRKDLKKLWAKAECPCRKDGQAVAVPARLKTKSAAELQVQTPTRWTSWPRQFLELRAPKPTMSVLIEQLEREGFKTIPSIQLGG